MATVTHTRTHVHTSFANPYLLCDQCKEQATSFHDGERCGCESGCWLLPCRHQAEAVSECPSWGPMDGCSCLEFLRKIPHPIRSES